jgi:hypothetical protein
VSSLILPHGWHAQHHHALNSGDCSEKTEELEEMEIPDWAKDLGFVGIIAAAVLLVLRFVAGSILEHEVQETWNTRIKSFLVATFSRSQETTIYDSAKKCNHSDFQGKPGQRWSDIEHKSVGPVGEGVLTILEGGVLNVERIDRGGRFEIWLRRYNYRGSEFSYLPENPQMTGERRLRVTCQAKVTDGRHTLWFLFKDQTSNKSPEPPKEVVIDRNKWIPIDLTFALSPAATYSFRIDDQEVSHVPSVLHIRGLKLTEITG